MMSDTLKVIPTLELLREKRNDIMTIAAHHNAENVRVFGSVARGDATQSSDVDLLVEFSHPHSLIERVALKQALEDLLNCHVDVVTDKTLSRYIRQQVLREAIPL